MKRPSALPTLDVALEWLDGLLDELGDAPVRLHDHAVGDKDALGSPRFSGAFWHRLVGSAFASHEVKSPVNCYHPLLQAQGDRSLCPECFGANVKEATRDVYDRPLSAALVKLSRRVDLGRPLPIHYILALIESNLDVPDASVRLGMPIVSEDHRITVDAAFLRALRQLHDGYSSGPIGAAPKWTDLSESQQRAILAA